MTALSEMYISLFPAIMAGIFNMIWCKSKLCDFMKKPVDFGKDFCDKRRIFGENKTWKGFVGMIIGGCVFSVLWGLVCGCSEYLTEHNYFYVNYLNTIEYNAFTGILIGFAYALFELPNSFLKRRLDITPGKTTSGFKKVFFVFLDQADSIFGCVLVICLFYSMPLWFYLLYVFVGAATHIVLNILLYLVKLRKNMF